MKPLLTEEERKFISQYEERKAKLRQQAVTNEMDRLHSQLKRKKRVISLQRIMLVMLITGVLFLIFRYTQEVQSSPVKPSPIQKVVTRIPEPTLVEIKPAQPESHKPLYLKVQFSHLPEYPIAQFHCKQSAEKFCRLLEKLDFPPVKISRDSAYSILPTTDSLQMSPVYYGVQIGAYERDFLKAYRDSLIWLKYHNDNGLHKYRMEPFSGFSKGKAFVEKLQGQECFIVKY